jgi:hypothetical protein
VKNHHKSPQITPVGFYLIWFVQFLIQQVPVPLRTTSAQNCHDHESAIATLSKSRNKSATDTSHARLEDELSRRSAAARLNQLKTSIAHADDKQKVPLTLSIHV